MPFHRHKASSLPNYTPSNFVAGGASNIESLVKRAAKIGMPALAFALYFSRIVCVSSPW
jgi:hypothetical protein